MGFSQVLRDITRRKQTQDALTASLREKRGLAKEIHHRVKNNLQMISSLLRLQSENISRPGPPGHFLESQNRVRSMAIIHESLPITGPGPHGLFGLRAQTDRQSAPNLGVQMDKNQAEARRGQGSPEPGHRHPPRSHRDGVGIERLEIRYPGGREEPSSFNSGHCPGNGFELTIADDGVGLDHAIDFESTNPRVSGWFTF
ncbi:MAG: sensor histidine kinase [Elusimicrobia bacterium]|nr:sensor histidine kinase [Elusimicrobiota bacterium]